MHSCLPKIAFQDVIPLFFARFRVSPARFFSKLCRLTNNSFLVEVFRVILLSGRSAEGLLALILFCHRRSVVNRNVTRPVARALLALTLLSPMLVGCGGGGGTTVGPEGSDAKGPQPVGTPPPQKPNAPKVDLQ